jgi:gamma-carbonic anhydrase
MDYMLGHVLHRSVNATVRPHAGLWPRLHPSVFLADGARVLGDVEIGQNSSIWFNTVVRGDVHRIEVGASTNIQDGAIIHCTYRKFGTRIGNNVSIAHLAMVHGCVIEDDCLIGMHAVIMDGVVVGQGSIVGAGALVTQHMKIPPGSLVLGSPAKVIRNVTPEEKAGFLETAARYVKYTEGYDFRLGQGS